MAAKLSRTEREARAVDRTTPNSVLRDLACDRSERVRVGVAMNPSTPIDLLLTLVDDPSAEVSVTAVHNLSADRQVWKHALARGGQSLLDVAQVPWLPEDLATGLARHEDWHVRAAVARSTVWGSVLATLSTDAKVEVRAAVASSEWAGSDLIEFLSRDPRKEVRSAVALNPTAPTRLLADFAHDRSADVRWAVVATHPHQPELERLFVDDPDPLVRRHARHHLENPATLTFREDGTFLYNYAGGPGQSLGEMFQLDDPIGNEALRQGAEREARRRAIGTSSPE